MKKILRALYRRMVRMGLEPYTAIRTAGSFLAYLRDLREFRRQCRQSPPKGFRIGRLRPYLRDRFATSGTAVGHYFHQDLLVAQRIFERRPERHLDVGSRIDGLVAHVASFRTIEVLDIRDLHHEIRNIRFVRADLMADLDASLVGCCDSLSCLHALEHFGLGRYGDPVRLDGHERGLRNLGRLVRPGGDFYLSAPIGPARIEFNAQRVFAVGQIVEMLGVDFEIRAFHYVDDRGHLHREVALSGENMANSCGCRFGCGIFEAVRK